MSIFDKIKDKFNAKKIVVIAEKYSAALDYSKALECKRCDEYFEGDKYIIVWTDGHLCTLYDPEDYNNKFKAWKLEDLPIIPNGFWIKTRKGKQKKLNLIKDLVERNDVCGVCIGTDSAREGNLIGEYVLMAIENKKPVYRVMINALNKKEILEGFKNIKLSEDFKTMSLAAQARDEIDWLIGDNLSRAYSLVNRKKYYVGRCKTVLLSMLCKREDQINSHKQKLYFNILSNFVNDSYSYSGTLLGDTIENKIEAEKIKNSVEGAPGSITKISKEIKSLDPELLYNLNDLIRAVNRRFGYAADEIYDIAQKLYDHKLISYSRTDCRYVKKSMIPDIEMILNCVKFGKFKDRIHGIKDISKFTYRCVDDNKVIEHTAIIPILNEKAAEVYRDLNDKERNVYDVIVNNFINNFLENYEYESILIETTVKEYKFITRNHRTLNYGWQSYENVQNSYIDGIKEMDSVISSEVIIDKKLSKPPQRYTDNTFFELLENPGKFVEDKNFKKILKENGIGTNATRALLLKDLIINGYVVREKNYLVPTIEGQELISSLKTDKLKEPFFTAEIEEKLQQIQRGELDKDELIKSISSFITKHVQELKKDYEPKSKVIANCPLCNGKIVEAGNKGYGCTNFKTTGCRFYISKDILEAVIDKEQVYKIVTNEESDLLTFVGNKGTFKAKIVLENGKTKFKYVMGES